MSKVVSEPIEGLVELDDRTPECGDYLKENLLYNAIQLNEHLSNELRNLQEQRSSKITNRVVKLAEATVRMTELALYSIPDIDTSIKNTMR